MHLQVFGLFILAALHAGECLQCYNCDSRDDPNCMDGANLPEKHKTDCNSAAIKQFTDSINTASQTITDWGNQLGIRFDAPKISPDIVACQKVEYTDEAKSKHYVLRSCAPAMKDTEDMCNYVQSKLTSSNSKVLCSQCKSDYCNSSNMVSPTLFTTFITMVAIFYFNK